MAVEIGLLVQITMTCIRKNCQQRLPSFSPQQIPSNQNSTIDQNILGQQDLNEYISQSLGQYNPQTYENIPDCYDTQEIIISDSPPINQEITTASVPSDYSSDVVSEVAIIIPDSNTSLEVGASPAQQRQGQTQDQGQSQGQELVAVSGGNDSSINPVLAELAPLLLPEVNLNATDTYLIDTDDVQIEQNVENFTGDLELEILELRNYELKAAIEELDDSSIRIQMNILGQILIVGCLAFSYFVV
eukprot:TRINITY_DN3781_c1_g1_i3.p1 TRINITY_DN3781_c1_g1~~TRINITY_DN3781_c1_g1_i3.p1  ORF type:complete len:245 (-),score=31.75 TRINITY_DN3781_c1_g1_i3:155-889(-)